MIFSISWAQLIGEVKWTLRSSFAYDFLAIVCTGGGTYSKCSCYIVQFINFISKAREVQIM